jgi:hypothetical protein
MVAVTELWKPLKVKKDIFWAKSGKRQQRYL